jgi:hypothetical protein
MLVTLKNEEKMFVSLCKVVVKTARPKLKLKCPDNFSNIKFDQNLFPRSQVFSCVRTDGWGGFWRSAGLRTRLESYEGDYKTVTTWRVYDHIYTTDYTVGLI